MQLGERIRRLRLTREIGQTELGQIMGVGQPAISRWERGEGIDPKNYPAIAKFLGTTTAQVAAWAHADEDDDVSVSLQVAEITRQMEDLARQLAELREQQDTTEDGPSAHPAAE